MHTKLTLVWTGAATDAFNELRDAAINSRKRREKARSQKSSKPEGLFNQLVKCLTLLETNPRHPGLRTHEFTSIEHPYSRGEKVFEAYVQHKTPGAYRVFWCYGPAKAEITVIAITPHP